MGKKEKNDSQRPSVGFVVGRILSASAIAAQAIGKFALNTSAQLISSAVGFSSDTRKEYNRMGTKSQEEIKDILTGKKISTPSEKTAAAMYVKDLKREVDEEDY